ncbi:hypothetical protein GCM10022255_090910 [Dactylosporangium darangshiense]|uniref:Uncharacterized protein n=1 Tax=Dactylosporangium darangshiense TaxID=579108 RepID=A0ABP8DP60_9ACTN
MARTAAMSAGYSAANHPSASSALPPSSVSAPHAVSGQRQRHGDAERVEPPREGARRVQVVVGEPAHRRGRLRVGGRQLAGEGAQQVVLAVSAGPRLRDQVSVGELSEHLGGALGGDAGEARRDRRADVVAGLQAEQPEHPCQRRAQHAVRPREHRPHVGHHVGSGERVELLLRAGQLEGDVGECPARVDGRAGGSDRQGQRQAGAPVDDLLDRGGLTGHPLRAEPPSEQVPGLLPVEQIQRKRHGALAGDQAPEAVAAGDDDQATGRARQQGPHLRGVAGVVEHDEHAAAGDGAAVQRGLRVQPGRHSVGGHPEPVEQHPQRVTRGESRAGRAEAAQVDVQLPVGKPVRGPVRPVHGQGGLADPGGPRQRRDDDGDAAPLRAGGEGVELSDRRAPSGEPAHVQRHLRGHGRRWRGPRSHRRWVGLLTEQQRAVQRLQRRSGVGAQRVGEALAQTGVHVEGLGVAPLVPQRPHEALDGRLGARMLGDDVTQRPDHRGGTSGRQLGVGPGDGGVPALLRPAGTLRGGPRALDVGERSALPQVQRCARVGGGQPAEAVQVHNVGFNVEQVRAGPPGDRHDVTQPGDVDVHRLADPVGRLVPDPVNQVVDGDRRAGVDGEHRQDGALPGVADAGRLPADAGLHGAQQPDRERCMHRR